MLLKSRIFTFVTGLILITNPITFSAALAQEVTPPEQECASSGINCERMVRDLS